MNPRLNLSIHQFCDTEQLDRETKLLRVGDIDRRDVGNPFRIDVAVDGVPRQVDEDGQLVRRIDPATSNVGSASAYRLVVHRSTSGNCAPHGSFSTKYSWTSR